MEAQSPKRLRPDSGQSIIETVVGIIFLIPIVLFLLDIAVLVMANTANDNLCKAACRAAASAKDTGTNLGTAKAGYDAAVAASNTFVTSDIINKPSGGTSFVTSYCWNGMGNPDLQGTSWPSGVPQPADGHVTVLTTMTVKVPVPFPGLPSTIDFHDSVTEPVVSVVIGADRPVNTAAAASSLNGPMASQNGTNSGAVNGSQFAGSAPAGIQSTDDTTF